MAAMGWDQPNSVPRRQDGSARSLGPRGADGQPRHLWPPADQHGKNDGRHASDVDQRDAIDDFLMDILRPKPTPKFITEADLERAELERIVLCDEANLHVFRLWYQFGGMKRPLTPMEAAAMPADQPETLPICSTACVNWRTTNGARRVGQSQTFSKKRNQKTPSTLTNNGADT